MNIEKFLTARGREAKRAEAKILGANASMTGVGMEFAEWDRSLQFFTFRDNKPVWIDDIERCLDTESIEIEYDCAMRTFGLLLKTHKVRSTDRSGYNDAFRKGLCGDALKNEILHEISKISTPLCVFVPYNGVHDIPIPEVDNECDSDSPGWRRFTRMVSTMSADCLADAKVEEIRQNATYGGMGGIVLFVNGAIFAEWVKTGDLFAAAKAYALSGKTAGPKWTESKITGKPKLWITVLDLVNGSGHDQQIEADWSKLKEPIASGKWVIVNNLIDSVFGVCGISKIDFGDNTTHSGLVFIDQPKLTRSSPERTRVYPQAIGLLMRSENIHEMLTVGQVEEALRNQRIQTANYEEYLDILQTS